MGQTRRLLKDHRASALAVSLALSLAALLATRAMGETVALGKLIVSIEGTISPARLPRRSPTPITLAVKGQIKTTDGSHVPALKTLSLEFDRHGTIYTKGLPTCRVGQLQSTLSAQARRVCGKALVGQGRAEAEIAFPEQAPFDASGPMLIFNGKPKGRDPVLIIHVHANVPAPTTFVTTAVIGRSSGKYGTKTLIKIPTIVGGQGSLIAFHATLHRTWTYRGRQRSLLYASCPTGSLLAHGEFSFADGTQITGDFAKGC